jgi:hypothetical protein
LSAYDVTWSERKSNNQKHGEEGRMFTLILVCNMLYNKKIFLSELFVYGFGIGMGEHEPDAWLLSM